MKCEFNINCKLNNTDYCSDSCERYIKLKYLFDQSLIPKKYMSPVSLYIDSDNSDKEVFNYLKSIQDNIFEIINKGTNLYLFSNIPGNGKTSWSIRLMKAYIYNIWSSSNLEPRALFINVPKYLLELKSNIEEKSDYIQHVKTYINKCDLVVWDDIATKSATEFEHEHLLSMIDYRLYNLRSNIFTSNVFPNDLHELLGSRLSSRIINESQLLQFVGKDKRGLEWKIKS